MSEKILLFDCIGTLIDGAKIRVCYQRNMSQVMSARYGNSPEFWQGIDQQLIADWDSYHADLNFSGEDGIADMHEAHFRTTRALFLIAKIPEPTKSEITALANELHSTPCNDSVLLPDALPMLQKMIEKGFQIGAFAYLLETQVKALTASLPMLTHHVGADTVNHYEHDTTFFRNLAAHLKTPPEQITVITRSQDKAEIASQSGFSTLYVGQSPTSHTQILEVLLKE